MNKNPAETEIGIVSECCLLLTSIHMIVSAMWLSCLYCKWSYQQPWVKNNHRTCWNKLLSYIAHNVSEHLCLLVVCVSLRRAPCPQYVIEITAPTMHWGHPGCRVCVCLCLFLPLERRCASLEPNLACFILCFHANPTRSTNESCECWGEEFKNLSALMSTLTLYMLIRPLNTSYTILNGIMEL